jgi:polar amino acid transport system substrate-binding protein
MQAAAKESPPDAGGISPDSIREQFDKVYHNLVSASDRIRNILSHVSRLSPNASSTGHRHFDIDEAVSVSIHMLEERIQSATHRFSHQPAENIPPAIGNPRHLRQALINLLLNACQALEHPEQAVIVRTFALPATSGAVIEIRDEGRGIPPEILSQVRFPFFTTRRSQKALGMGLSIAERIISDMGGLLQIDSVAGEGTLVSVQLPTAPTGDIEEENND